MERERKKTLFEHKTPALFYKLFPDRSGLSVSNCRHWSGLPGTVYFKTINLFAGNYKLSETLF